ncbi:MAG: ParB N-terminal domain-containing protein [Acidobacteria bacterium]|nr:ParB N-terminal domain-containing protein [Acidobacteriota bacterium]
MTKPGQPKLKYLSPDRLDFDPENPRFAGEVSGKTQDEIQRYVYGKPHYASELVDSLLENGFIDYEPLVVKRKNGRYVVIEGNRRLAAIREIRANLGQYQGRISDLAQIPVIIFPKKPDPQLRNEMRVYLGVRHLLGIRQWPPISKAQFLERESKSPGGLDRVIKEVRLTKQQVRRFLVPFRLLKAARAALPPDEDFWVLGEALQRTGVKNFLQLHVDSATLEIRNWNKTNFRHLLDDLYGPKEGSTKKRDVSRKVVEDTRDLSRLARVLGSQRASYVLHKGKSLEEAELYVDTSEESLKRLEKLTKDMDLLLKKILPSKKDPEGDRLQKTFKEFESAVRAFVKRNA